MGFSLLVFCSAILRLGLDNVLVRTFGAEGMTPKSLETFAFSLRWVCSIAVIVSVLGAFFSSAIAVYVFNKPDFSDSLIWFMLALPFVIIYSLMSFVFQGLQKVILATWFQQLGVGLVFIFLFGWGWLLVPDWLTSQNSSFLFFCSSVIMLLMAFGVWVSQENSALPDLNYAWKNSVLWQASSNLWAIQVLILTVQWSGVLVAGVFVSPEDVAHLSAAHRTANVTSFILMVVNMALAPRYALLWREKKINELRRLAVVSTRAMIIMALPLVAFILIFPAEILKIFGKGFEQAAILLSIMAVGQFVNVATGSVGYLLNMSGHERDLRRTIMFTAPLSIFLSIFLTYMFGVLGAAFSTAIGIVIQSFAALMIVKRRLGFWPIG